MKWYYIFRPVSVFCCFEFCFWKARKLLESRKASKNLKMWKIPKPPRKTRKTVKNWSDREVNLLLRKWPTQAERVQNAKLQVQNAKLGDVLRGLKTNRHERLSFSVSPSKLRWERGSLELELPDDMEHECLFYRDTILDQNIHVRTYCNTKGSSQV